MSKLNTKFISELYRSRNVLWQLVAQQLILRYRRTALGYLWTLINPLVMMSIMAWVFSNLFKAEIKSFTVFLFAGMIPWTFFSSVTIQSGASFINNEGLIKKIYIPKIIFPLSIAFALLVDSLLSFLALFTIILILGGKISLSLLFLPIAFALLFFFTLGIALIMSIATVFFRDLQHVILIAMQGLFFLTPIVYEKAEIDGWIAWLVEFNPITPFIELFRTPLTQAILPDNNTILHCSAISLVFFVIGFSIFLYQEKNIVFRL
jgi:ABC-2 type transport system permease protein/lipopolysaccharide transport system permease protein